MSARYRDGAQSVVFAMPTAIKEQCSYLSRNSKLSTVPANSITQDRYTVLVVRMAQIVPMGMLFCASAKSPERLDPAMMPVTEGKKMPIRMVKVVVMSAIT